MTSIIIPVYNLSRYIAEALDSVRSQTITDWEAIVVDDCSTDDSRAVVSGYINQTADSRIRLISLDTNRGVSVARNTAIHAARGDWIAFLDADDSWTPGHLATQKDALARHPEALMAFSKVQTVDSQGETLSSPTGPFRIQGLLGTASGELDKAAYGPFLLDQIYAPVSTVLVHKSTLMDVGGFPEGLRHQCEDIVTWTRIARRAPICFTPTVTARYRVHESSWSSRQDPVKVYDIHLHYILTVMSLEGRSHHISRALARWGGICICDRLLSPRVRLNVLGRILAGSFRCNWIGGPARVFLACSQTLLRAFKAALAARLFPRQN